MIKPRILLVVPPSPVRASELGAIESSMKYLEVSSPHLGLSYLGSNLERHKFEVIGYDARFDQGSLTLEKIAERILEKEPAAVGFSATTNSANNVIRLTKLIRAKSNQNIPVVVGGSHVSARMNSHPIENPISGPVMDELGIHKYCIAEAMLRGVTFETERFPKIEGEKLFDAVVVGDCFDWGHDLFRIVLEGKGKRLDNELSQMKGVAFIDLHGKFHYTGERHPFESLAKLSYPNIEIFGVENYLLPGTIVGNHGCPNLCSYCTCPSTANRTFIRGEAQKSINDILYLNRRYGINSIRINDDVATYDKQWIAKFSRGLKELREDRNINILWACSARVDQVDKVMLQLMADAGCYSVQYGIESCTDKGLDAIHKRIRKDEIVKGFTEALDAGIPVVRGNIIVGFPLDDLETLVSDFQMVKEFHQIGGERVKIGVSALTPYPGSLECDRGIQGYMNYQKSGEDVFRTLHFNFDKYFFHEINVVNEAFPSYEAMNLAHSILFGAVQEIKKE